LVPLALVHRARRDHDLPRQMHSDVRALPHRRAPALADRTDPGRRGGAADLDVRREADPEVAAFRAGGLLLEPEVVVADDLERPLQRLFLVAGVVLQPAEDAPVLSA